MPDIFDEVEEDLRNERARALGRRYAGLGIAALVLILAGTGGYVFWQQNRIEASNAVANRFIDAAREADKASAQAGGPDAAGAASAAKTLSAIAQTGPEGYRVLARLRLATLQWQAGQHAQAAATWQAVSDDPSAPQLLRDLATLTSAQTQLDSADPVLLRQRLQTLTGPDNTWRPMAEQILALLDIRTGRQTEAAATLQRLTMDGRAPEGMRQMAADLLSTLPPDAVAAASAPPKLPSPAAPTPKTQVPAAHAPKTQVPAAHAAAAHG